MMLSKNIKELLFLSQNYHFRVIIVIFESSLSFLCQRVNFESKLSFSSHRRHFRVGVSFLSQNYHFRANYRSRVQISISEP